LNFLRTRSYEQRVAIFPLIGLWTSRGLPRRLKPLEQQYKPLPKLYGFEWTQHLFQYYNIQSLRIVQEPRLAGDKAEFEAVMIFAPLRKWELTNTRYLVGIAALLDLFNHRLMPRKKRLRVASGSIWLKKPGSHESPVCNRSRPP